MPRTSKKPATRRTKKARSKAAAQPGPNFDSYRHDARRKNIPPAGLAAHGQVKEVPKTRYFYDAHIPPVLHLDEAALVLSWPHLGALPPREQAITRRSAAGNGGDQCHD